MNHLVALYKGADETVLEKPKPYDDDKHGEKMNDDGVVLEHTYGPKVLSYQTHWLISWKLMMVKSKKRRRKKTTLTISVKAMVNDHLVAHERLMRASSVKIILVFYIPISIN